MADSHSTGAPCARSNASHDTGSNQPAAKPCLVPLDAQEMAQWLSCVHEQITWLEALFFEIGRQADEYSHQRRLAELGRFHATQLANDVDVEREHIEHGKSMFAREEASHG